ncbi:MAG: hypothetical protein V4576_02160 [Patescibacteria group bacterium]
MKKTIILLALIITVSAQAIQISSTSTPSREPKIEARVEAMKVKLDTLKETRDAKASSTIKREIKTVDPVCAKAAVDVRDTAIATAFSAHSTNLLAAMTTRTTVYKAAFDLTGSARVQAIRVGQEAFRKSRMSSRETFLRTERASWTTFKTSMKACGATPSEINAADVSTSIAL